MPVSLKQPSDLISVKGVEFSAVDAGLYQNKSRDDLVLIKLRKGSQVAAVFTKNVFCAAPVSIAKSHLDITDPEYLLINAGNANAGTGKQGIKDAIDCCNSLSEHANIQVSQILPFSTGVIGQRLPLNNIIKKIPELVSDLSESMILQAAEAIKTTDTVAKAISKKLVINGRNTTITGIAKGSGMIKPDMATMLAYVFTDADINKNILEKMLTHCVDKTFNRITVDGDTSTNDACLLAATGLAAVSISDQNSEEYEDFSKGLIEVFKYLAQAIVRDGEGATKFVTIKIEHAVSTEECLSLAYTVAHSPLVKTALFASDPNWGRILAAVGRSKIKDLDISSLDIYLAETCVIRSGELCSDYSEEKGQQEMAKDEILIRIDLNRGSVSEEIWTSDLSYDYVKINAEYRT